MAGSKHHWQAAAKPGRSVCIRCGISRDYVTAGVATYQRRDGSILVHSPKCIPPVQPEQLPDNGEQKNSNPNQLKFF